MEVLFIRYFAEAFEECMECEVLAEIDWKIDERTVVAPDVVVVCNDEGEKHLITSPKIIVEILSPSTEQKDRVLKFELYEQNGVEYYILADPSKKTFEIYKLEDGKFIKDYDLDSKYRFKFDSCEKEFDFSKIFVK
jgi:Uma2 family endonuclease